LTGCGQTRELSFRGRILPEESAFSQPRPLLRAMGNQFAKLRALPHHKLFVLSVSSA
jgi:hypothetical protein